MKQTKFLMVAAVMSAALFSSCQPEEAVERFGVSQTEVVLTSIGEVAYVNVTGVGPFTVVNLHGNIATVTYEGKVITIAAQAYGEFDFTITDKSSQSITIHVTVQRGALQTFEFTWKRSGSPAGTGLDQFGLEWKSNAGSPVAAIVKKTVATKMVILPTAAYNENTFVSEIDSRDNLAQYDGIEIKTQDLDEYLGVKYNGKYYALYFKHIEVGKNESGGTIATITGEYKVLDTE